MSSTVLKDYFSLLGEPRRPWLDTAELKQKFLDLSAQSHPDRTHHRSPEEQRNAHDRYVELNAAYHCLREPKDRVRHLLELERGEPLSVTSSTPEELMDLFLQIAKACREADVVIGERDKTSSPLLKVKWFERSQNAIQHSQELRQELTRRHNLLIDELKQIDGLWSGTVDPGDREELLRRLEALCRRMSYYGRWLSQLQERELRLFG